MIRKMNKNRIFFCNTLKLHTQQIDKLHTQQIDKFKCNTVFHPPNSTNAYLSISHPTTS